MIKTILGILIFSAVIPVLLSPFIEILIQARGSAFLLLGEWMVYGSLLGLSCLLALVVFITLYRLLVH